MFAYLDGLPSSSTRAELLGLIISLYSPGPVHTALDNASVVSFAQILLHQLNHHPYVSSCPSFAPKNNGDLRKIFYRAVTTRGPRSVKVSKTQGHALEKLQAGCTPELYSLALHND
eukprot:96310-Karenia_brevis.AAC.1